MGLVVSNAFSFYLLIGITLEIYWNYFIMMSTLVVWVTSRTLLFTHLGSHTKAFKVIGEALLMTCLLMTSVIIASSFDEVCGIWKCLIQSSSHLNSVHTHSLSSVKFTIFFHPRHVTSNKTLSCKRPYNIPVKIQHIVVSCIWYR